jgi:hypothetical protein
VDYMGGIFSAVWMVPFQSNGNLVKIRVFCVGNWWFFSFW